MGNPLRDRQSLEALAGKRQVIEILEKVGSFERLADCVRRDLAVLDDSARPLGWRERPVRGRLVFGRADTGHGRPTLTVQLEAGIPAVCQRCLEAFEWPLVSRAELEFGAPASSAPGEDERELWELPDDLVQPIDIVDELLVMALPLAARHEDGAGCSTGDAPVAGKETTRPFADLKSQMGRKAKD
jgi:uncharacterized metal-binding protein YceD (DUF177 family)